MLILLSSLWVPLLIVQESYKEGATVASLAKKYGVSSNAIHRWRQSTSSEEKIEDKEVEDKFIKVPIQKSTIKRTFKIIKSLI